jgi:hypothetical protein
LIARYAAGWERGFVVRDRETVVYGGNPRIDVYGEDWLAYAMNGDIRIFRQDDLRTEISLPVTINTREREFDPSLVRSHDGRYALLWARGTSARTAARFVALSSDLVRWEPPQRLAFEEPPADVGYTYEQAEPLQRSYNVAAVRGGYVMLLGQGFLRHSKDLRHWGPPGKALPQDLLRNRLLAEPDGTLWAVYETSSSARQPYTDQDWLHGFFVVDGKRYRHVTELRVSRSVNGADWQDVGAAAVPGQPTALWAFAIGEGRIGIGLGANRQFVRWFTTSAAGPLEPVDSRLQLVHQTDDAQCFVRDASLTCAQPVFDADEQKPILFATTTERLLEGYFRR